ncbi:MAG: hypothetical protein ACMUIG_00945 [Thermoplasmatota archaeon]
MSGEKRKSYFGGLPGRAAAVTGGTVKRLLFRKSTILAFALLMIPPAISTYLLFDTPEGFNWLDMFSSMGLYIYLQILILLYCLIFGSSLIHEEIDQRTITYVTIRGLKRWEPVIYKYAGYVISLSILFWISIAFNYLLLGMNNGGGGILPHLDLLLALMMISTVSIIVYGALFMMIGIAFRKPLMVGLLFAFIWEIFIANLPSNIKSVTIMFYLRSLYHQWIPRGGALDLGGMTGVVTALIALDIFTVIFLAAGILIFSRKDLH